MSVSPQIVTGQCQPSSSSLPGSSNEPQQSVNTGTSDDKPCAVIEKIISCVSCRKRKLKCDRVQPKCGTCTRLRHECEYPERKRNPGSKRRNMRELEARLAQVESQLVAETKGGAASKSSAVHTTEPDWNNFKIDMNMDMETGGLFDESFDVSLSAFDLQSAALPKGDFFPQELISLGLQEPLPPNKMIDELHEIYFDKFHPTLPMIHKYRYLASLNLPPHMQTPICLRYAMWAIAATYSEAYAQYDDVLYNRARKYIEAAEMKGHGETFVKIQYAQTWSLIGAYEAKKTYFTRAWMSSGRATRLCQMLGLQHIDGEMQDVKRILRPVKNWIELEESRRTFWAAFFADRWASSGTGWPMVIVENEIQTNLPASEESFEAGIIGESITLKEVFTPEGASRLTPFGGLILSTCLFGHNFQHFQKDGEDERPEDFTNGEFWKRHRHMDNVLSDTFMSLPDNLRLPGGLRDTNVVFLHINFHACTIYLHQGAALAARQNNISKHFIRQSRDRSLMAAEEITNIIKHVSHLDASDMSSWLGFCLYVAGDVFIQDQKGDKRHPQSISNLEFLLAAMKAVGNRHLIARHFVAKLELELESAGIKPWSKPSRTIGTTNSSPHEFHPSRSGVQIAAARKILAPCAESKTSTSSDMETQVEEVSPYISRMAQMASFAQDKTSHPYSVTPSASPEFPKAGHSQITDGVNQSVGKAGQPSHDVVPHRVSDFPNINHHPEGIHEHMHPSLPNWNPPSNITVGGSSDPNQFNKLGQSNISFKSQDFAPSHLNTAEINAPAGESPFNINSFIAGNMHHSDSSSPNPMHFSNQQAAQTGQNKLPPNYSMVQADSKSFITADWTSEIPFNTESRGEFYRSPSDILPTTTDAARVFVGAQGWSQNPALPHG